jgi:hypothetical protein
VGLIKVQVYESQDRNIAIERAYSVGF